MAEDRAQNSSRSVGSREQMMGPCTDCGKTVSWDNVGSKEKPHYITSDHAHDDFDYYNSDEHYFGEHE